MINLNTVIDAAARQRLVTGQQAETLRPRLEERFLPLDTQDVTIPDDLWPHIFLELYGLATGTSTNVGINEARQRIAALKIEELLKVHERLQDNFERRNWVLAVALLAGGTVRAWQTKLLDAIKRLILSQFVLGSGRVPTTAELAILTEKVKREAAFLKRFALTVALSLSGQSSGPASEASISSRGSLYSGVARGTFYQAMEDRIDQLTDQREGWVMEYIPRDDVATCTPCSKARGFYLIGAGPYPGQVCEGRGRCRCQRVPRFLPNIFRSLHTLHY